MLLVERQWCSGSGDCKLSELVAFVGTLLRHVGLLLLNTYAVKASFTFAFSQTSP